MSRNLLTAAMLLCLWVPTASYSQNTNYVRAPEEGVGAWNDGANWSLEAAPTDADTARINNGGMVLVDEASVADRLLVGAAANGTGSVEITTGGTLTLDGSASQLGGGDGAEATISVTGGTFNYTGTAATDIARFGTATLNVSAGSFNTAATLRVAVFDQDGQGTINLSGGEINVGANFSLMQGVAHANFETRSPFAQVFHTGGAMNVTGTTYVGFPSAGDGTALYEIGAGKLDTGAISIGGSNQATFRITDPAADITFRSSMAIANNTYFEAVAGSTVKFTDPTGALVLDVESPFFNQNVYSQNSMDIANSSRVAGLGNTTLLFAGGELEGAEVGLFEVAGTDLGAVEEGFENNFALGGLAIGADGTIGNLKLTDALLNGAPDATPQALYVDQLDITAGSVLDLSGLNLYYRTGSVAGSVLGGSLTQVGGSQGTAGDYNDDGVVNLADYTVWRDNLGSASPLPNDEVGGTVGALQYDQWKMNFGAAPALAQTATVPEPSSALLLLTGAMLLVASRKN